MTTQEQLAEIGKEMAKQDNHATAAPVWIVGRKGDRFPRIFFTEVSAEGYIIEKYGLDDDGEIPAGIVNIASGHDSTETLILMKACLEAAGLNPENNKQVANAYSGCWRV